MIWNLGFTNLEFGISELGFVSLKAYNILGKEVATVVNENLSPGTYKIVLMHPDYQAGSILHTQDKWV